jgi:fructoselysine-6-P-deglycase FrlB-like protein
MTRFLRDILRQPNELLRTIDFLLGAGRSTLDAATTAIRGARHVYLTGIGSSWHAALSAGPLFHLGAHPVYVQDAAELLLFATFPPDSAMVAIARSGRSMEIVNLLAKVRNSGVTVIGITNSADAPLAREGQISIVVPTEMDGAPSGYGNGMTASGQMTLDEDIQHVEDSQRYRHATTVTDTANNLPLARSPFPHTGRASPRLRVVQAHRATAVRSSP